MKTIMSVLLVMAMAFALVPTGEAETGSSSYDNPGAAFNAACISTPAYTDYIDIHEVACLPNEKVNLTPNPMGSAG